MRTKLDFYLFLASIAVIGAVFGFLFCKVVIPDMREEIRFHQRSK